METGIVEDRGRCEYCGAQLAASYYFCPRCGTPYKDVESVIEPMPDIEIDTETLVRTRAPQALNVYMWFLSSLVVAAIFSEMLFSDDEFGEAELFRTGVLAVLTIVFSALYWSSLKVQLARIGFDHGVTYLALLILAPLLVINYSYHGFWIDAFDLPVEDDYGSLYPTRSAAVFFVCIAPAVIEEIGFRGLIQHWLHAAIVPWKAIAPRCGSVQCRPFLSHQRAIPVRARRVARLDPVENRQSLPGDAVALSAQLCCDYVGLLRTGNANDERKELDSTMEDGSELMLQLILMLIFGVILAGLAHSKGRNPVGWFFVGALFFLYRPDHSALSAEPA